MDALSVANEAHRTAKSNQLLDMEAALACSYYGHALIMDRHFRNPMNEYLPEIGNNFSLKVTQGLYAGGAINYSIKLSELGQKMAELSVESHRQELHFVFTGEYLDMYKAQNTLAVLDQNFALTERELH